jgi:WD40 repeat protein
VTGSSDTKVKVVVAETGQVIYDTGLQDRPAYAVLYTTEYFISGSTDRQIMVVKFSPYANTRNRTVRIYSASTGTASGERLTGEGYIRAIAISPDNKILAAGGGDNSITLYNMDTRKIIHKPFKGHAAVSTSDIPHTEYALK